jgi:hypothetical protein
MKIEKAAPLKSEKMPKVTGEAVQGEITMNYRGLTGQKQLGLAKAMSANTATNKQPC